MPLRRRPVRSRKPRKVPPPAVRRARSPQLPHGAQLYFVLVLGHVASAFAAAVKKKLTPSVIARFGAKPDEEHTDAEDDARDGVEAVMSSLRESIPDPEESGEFLAGTTTTAKRVVQHSKDEFERLGIDLVGAEPDFGPLIDKWRRGCIERVTSIQGDQLDKLEKLLKDGAGMRAETLQKRILEQIDDVTNSRAEFIARDQVLKLNAQITKHRQQAAGIEKYVWTTSNDERVRDTHDELDGGTFAWDDPPVVNDDGDTGHPGDDYQCRCIPFPLLPELGDDDESDESDDDDEGGSDDAPSGEGNDDGGADDAGGDDAED